ncbi:hypothetical protein ACOSQ2_017534 [Xanthoceras sorbifolium]
MTLALKNKNKSDQKRKKSKRLLSLSLSLSLSLAFSLFGFCSLSHRGIWSIKNSWVSSDAVLSLGSAPRDSFIDFTGLQV